MADGCINSVGSYGIFDTREKNAYSNIAVLVMGITLFVVSLLAISSKISGPVAGWTIFGLTAIPITFTALMSTFNKRIPLDEKVKKVATVLFSGALFVTLAVLAGVGALSGPALGGLCLTIIVFSGIMVPYCCNGGRKKISNTKNVFYFS